MISSFQSYSDFESDYDLTFVPPKWKPNISETKSKSGTTGNGNGTNEKNDSKQQQNQRPEQQQRVLRPGNAQRPPVRHGALYLVEACEQL